MAVVSQSSIILISTADGHPLEEPTTLPNPELPHELPKPELPHELPIPELPHELPKPELPEVPKLPELPELPKPELPNLGIPQLPGFPQPTFPGIPDNTPRDIYQPLAHEGLINGAQRYLSNYPCKPSSAVTAEDFFFAGLAKESNTVAYANVATFPGLNTVGLTMNRVDFAPGGVRKPHAHPGSNEVVMVLQGKLLVGFLISSRNVSYSKVVNPGEVFVIPMGMVHFLQNVGTGKAWATTIFDGEIMYSSGTLPLSPAGYRSNPAIPRNILAMMRQLMYLEFI
ncbi:hypothetical protein H6P81_010789 [Aristolochia fimbriata]|uniref:Germin-like protein n=1 Tax=Aristolochia fimbriata TaxID=158543 RepID=A0AAV7EQF6_ARIFI|nr:hypothetical protein H6P81_010789 [Aristolochia fimbriata]